MALIPFETAICYKGARQTSSSRAGSECSCRMFKLLCLLIEKGSGLLIKLISSFSQELEIAFPNSLKNNKDTREMTEFLSVYTYVFGKLTQSLFM